MNKKEVKIEPMPDETDGRRLYSVVIHENGKLVEVYREGLEEEHAIQMVEQLREMLNKS